MDFWTLLKALAMGIVEGVTEFLPVSSTGHLIVAGELMQFAQSLGSDETVSTFEIFIQLGAILAVALYFIRDLVDLLRRAVHEATARQVLVNVALAFAPAAVIGVIFSRQIKALLFSPGVVAVMLIAGGLVMLLVESTVRRNATATRLEAMSVPQAVAVGLAQVCALVPGVSRSAATLIGGLLAGLDRQTALRFSFYLSIPTLGGATLFDFVRSIDTISVNALPAFGVGLIVSFIVALIVVKFFMGYVGRHNLKPFAWYRIGAGALLLALTSAGVLH
jgi:undecaprenyl-diphosphatase